MRAQPVEVLGAEIRPVELQALVPADRALSGGIVGSADLRTG